MPKPTPAETATALRKLKWYVDDLREAASVVDQAVNALLACDLVDTPETIRRVIGSTRRVAQANAKRLAEMLDHLAFELDVNTGADEPRASRRVGEPLPIAMRAELDAAYDAAWGSGAAAHAHAIGMPFTRNAQGAWVTGPIHPKAIRDFGAAIQPEPSYASQGHDADDLADPNGFTSSWGHPDALTDYQIDSLNGEAPVPCVSRPIGRLAAMDLMDRSECGPC